MTDSFIEYKANFDAIPYHRVLGITVLERRPSYGKIVLLKDENTPSGIGGSVHGGVLAAMVDIVMQLPYSLKCETAKNLRARQS